jgi:preprotein translocase subunit SecF
MTFRHAMSLYRGHEVPQLRLVDHRRWWFLFSAVLIVLSLVGLFWRGLNFSIDFEGGAQLLYPTTVELTAEEVAATVASFGIDDPQVQIVDGTDVAVRTESLTGKAGSAVELRRALAEQAGIDPSEVSVEDIGATWGGEISRKALQGLVVVLIAISIYIAFRFAWEMAIGAMVALVHDVVITAGIYALTGREVTPETVIAILTILGFSLYDTVVIYDKVQENTEAPGLVAKYGYAGVVNMSLNQTLMRSVNTSLVVLLPILSLLLFGGDTLKDFAFAMFVGVAIGAYSSIFIAAPILVLIKARDRSVQQLDARRTAREKAATRRQASAAAPTAPDDEGVPAAAAATSDAAASRATARTGGGTRPRSGGKRRPPQKRKRR